MLLDEPLASLDERLKLPVILGTFGLAVFAYVIGVGAGPSFFASLRTGGRAIVGVVLLLVAAAEPTGDPALVWRAAEREVDVKAQTLFD